MALVVSLDSSLHIVEGDLLVGVPPAEIQWMARPCVTLIRLHVTEECWLGASTTSLAACGSAVSLRQYAASECFYAFLSFLISWSQGKRVVTRWEVLNTSNPHQVAHSSPIPPFWIGERIHLPPAAHIPSSHFSSPQPRKRKFPELRLLGPLAGWGEGSGNKF